jgi:hypothetical protein
MPAPDEGVGACVTIATDIRDRRRPPLASRQTEEEIARRKRLCLIVRRSYELADDLAERVARAREEEIKTLAEAGGKEMR